MAKYCCLCKRKLGFMDSGFELDTKSPGYVLCSDCNFKKLDLRVAKTEEERQQKLSVFAELLNHPDTPQPIKDNLLALSSQGATAITSFEAEKKRKFSGAIPEIEFETKMHTLVQNYTSFVYIFKDRVMISRRGTLNGLPEDISLFYRDITSIQLGSIGGRPRITFTVPGMSAGSTTVATPVTNNFAIASTNTNHYADPCSIVFGMNQSGEAEHYCDIIKQYYADFKAKEQTGTPSAAVIQQDSAVDKLRKLKELKDMGILSGEEYEAKRQKLLAEI